MLNKIIDIIYKSSSVKVVGDLLLCNYVVTDKLIISDIYDERIIQNHDIESVNINDTIKLEFVISLISRYGFYESYESFIRKNRYIFPTNDIFIFESNKKLVDDLPFKDRYKAIVNLIEQLLKNSKYHYEEANVENAIIIRENSTLFLPLRYQYSDIKDIDQTQLNNLIDFTNLLKNENLPDRKDTFLNHLVKYLVKQEDDKKFGFLIRNFEKYFKNSQSSFNYYLSQYTYSKLKLELDSKALEFNQKLQTVINDSQTKLIAIPSALVLVLTTLDYKDIFAVKNYLSAFGLIIFCIFIQLFINNQMSSIGFINDSIQHFKNKFFENNLEEFENSFRKVEIERDKQINRLLLIKILLWMTPFITISIILFLSSYKILSLLLTVLFIIVSVVYYLKLSK